jgi:hypothetical protein
LAMVARRRAHLRELALHDAGHHADQPRLDGHGGGERGRSGAGQSPRHGGDLGPPACRPRRARTCRDCGVPLGDALRIVGDGAELDANPKRGAQRAVAGLTKGDLVRCLHAFTHHAAA